MLHSYERGELEKLEKSMGAIALLSGLDDLVGEAEDSGEASVTIPIRYVKMIIRELEKGIK